MKNLLVTGGTGLLGNNVVRAALEQGITVRVAVRSSSSRQPFDGLPVEIQPVDFHDPVSIGDALTDVDAVVHSAAQIWFGWKKLEQCRKTNVGITRLLGKACLDRGIRMVHVSSVDALPVGQNGEVMDEESAGGEKPPCNYVVTKREADQVMRDFFAQGLAGSIVHPGLMFGPWDWRPSSGELIQAIARLGTFFSCPTGGISVTDVRDVARSILVAAQQVTDGRSFILAGHNVPFKELCWKIADQCGVGRPRFRTGPLAYAGAATIAAACGLVGIEPMINTGTIRMARHWHYYSSDRARQELGYQIRDLDEILDNAIEWLESQKMIPVRRKT